MLAPMEEEITEVSFPVPTGFAAPDTAEEGQPFEVTARVLLRDGRLVLDSINGAKLAAEAVEDEEMDEDMEEMEEEETQDGESLQDAMSAAGYLG